jgi:ferredoxin
MRVSVDRTRCEANGLCVGVAPSLFFLDDEAELVILPETVPAESEADAHAAVSLCPVTALSISDASPP